MTNRVWILNCKVNGFSFKVFLRTIESKLRDYIETELPSCISYSGATPKEVEAASLLNLPIYCY